MSKISYVVFCDGACRGNPGPASIGVSIQDRDGNEIASLSEAIGHATNNIAEYKAVVRALEQLEELGAVEAEFRLDSQLIVRQIEGAYRVRDAKLKPLYETVRRGLDRLDGYAVGHIPRAENVRADALANAALDAQSTGG